LKWCFVFFHCYFQFFEKYQLQPQPPPPTP
jgi:hypothetical protein